jgi:magnesium chelatase family protein
VRERQRRRFEGSSLLTNADALAWARAGPAEVREHCRSDDAGKSLLRAAMQQLPMSARAYADPRGSDRILKLARTMARKSGLDLAGSDEIQTVHLAEAVQYRSRWQ